MQTVERELGREAGRVGCDPEPLLALRPALAKTSLFVHMRLVHRDQEVPVALRPGQHRLELLDKGLPLVRISPAEELPGFLPGQLQPVQDRAEGLAAARDREALTHPANQAAQGPARRRVGTGLGPGYGRALGGAEACAEFGFVVGTKRGRRPPVRR